MSGKNSKGNGYGKGTYVETGMFLSDAYMSLGQPGSSPTTSAVSAQILIMLLGKRRFGEVKDKKRNKVMARTDNNRFTLTYAEITSYGYRTNRQGKQVKGMITQPQATRAFDELLAKGFIKIIEHGGAYEKHKSVYALSDEYKQWQWGNPPVRGRQKDCRRGFQGAGMGAATKPAIAHMNVPTHTHTNV